MRALIAFFVLFNLNFAVAKSDDVKNINSSLVNNGYEWKLDYRIRLHVEGIESTIRNIKDMDMISRFYDKGELFYADDQKLHSFRPAWDFLGLIEKEKNSFRYKDNPDTISYVDARMMPSATLIISTHDGYFDDSDYKPNIESVAINGFYVCDNSKNDECPSYGGSSNSLETFNVEIDYVWDDVVAGKPFKVDVIYSKPLKDNPPYSNASNDYRFVFEQKRSYLLSTKEISLQIERNVAEGDGKARAYNEKVDYERLGIINAAKMSYLLYLVYLVVALCVIYNLKHLYASAAKLFIHLFKMLRLLLEYAKNTYIWCKSKIFKEKSILTKSDGFSKVSVSEELMRWSQLRDSKIISEEEFATVKEKLLESLRKSDKK